MIIKAVQKNTRQTPRKVRLVANQIKGLALADALRQLAVIEKKSTLVLLKTINQALANARHNHGLKIEDLKLKSILIGDGPRYKRFRAVSRGRAHTVVKRSCHVRVELESKDQAAKMQPVSKEAAKSKSAQKDSKVTKDAVKKVSDQVKTKTQTSAKSVQTELSHQSKPSRPMVKNTGKLVTQRRSGKR